MPTEDELMEEYHASHTVRGAIKELAIRGLVNTLHGRGSFVAEQVNPIVTTLTTYDPTTGGGGGEGIVYTAEVARSGRKASAGVTRVEMQRATRQVADALGIPVGSV